MNLDRTMDNKLKLEKRLKQATCAGDINTVQELLNSGVDVNSRDSVRGRTSLHWACERGYFRIVALLLNYGADKNIKSDFDETPASLSRDPQILQLLGVTNCSAKGQFEPMVHNVAQKYVTNDLTLGAIDIKHSKPTTNAVCQNDLVLKIRIADAPDPDFIEVELPQKELTYLALIRVCCQELELDPNQITKLRKLPNTKLRKDSDIQRLQNFQEIEVITESTQSPNNIPIVPANGYQSISKKDQTILY